MTTINFYAFLLTATMFISCGDNKKLDEVAVPLPEEASTTKVGNPSEVQVDEGGVFKMLGLPYAYDALEPHIDAKTMEIHYSKHHLAYANNLNKALKDTPMTNMSIEQIMSQLDLTNLAVRNNGGGYYNHNLFWSLLKKNQGAKPSGQLSEAIIRDFGSFEAFQEQFTEAAMKQFGSGWAWLLSDQTGKLSIATTANQDNPLMTKLGIKGGQPILCVDVWEHAYYLNYQNKRKDYLENFFQVVNWSVVEELYTKTLPNNETN